MVEPDAQCFPLVSTFEYRCTTQHKHIHVLTHTHKGGRRKDRESVIFTYNGIGRVTNVVSKVNSDTGKTDRLMTD